MELRAGYKKTDLGVIPEDWSTVELDQITSLMTNGFVGTAKTHYTETDFGVTYIQGFNVEENSFNFIGIKKVTPEFHRKHSKSCLKENDLLIVQTGDVGLTTIVPSELEGANCHALIITRFFPQSIESKYFSYYLNSQVGRARLKEIETGTTMKHINVGDLKYFLVPLPPTKTEQTAIAKALSDVDSLIAELEKLIHKKRQIKQGAMQRLLNPLDEKGELKAGWEKKKLSQLAKIQRGASPRPIDSPVWFDENSAVGWLRISDVTKSKKYLLSTTQKLSPAGIDNSRFVPSNSLVMSICATVGRPIITKVDLCIHDGFVVFNEASVNLEYLYYFLTDIESDWGKHGQTGSQMNLNTGLINSTDIHLPKSNDEQAEIAGTLAYIDSELTSIEAKLAKTQKLKQGMMQKLLTGQIRLVKPQQEQAA